MKIPSGVGIKSSSTKKFVEKNKNKRNSELLEDFSRDFWLEIEEKPKKRKNLNKSY